MCKISFGEAAVIHDLFGLLDTWAFDSSSLHFLLLLLIERNF